MWLAVLLQEFVEVAQSEQSSRLVRVICAVVISLVFLIAITSLFLMVFVIEGQSLFRRGIFLIMGAVALVHYLQFLNVIVRKGGRKLP